MSTNKHATIRYQALDRCFRNPGRRYYIDDLVNECNEAISNFNFDSDGIKRRQLFEDIRFMESESGWSIPLERFKEGKKVYYRYSDLSFSINHQPLNESDANQLKETLLLLSRFKGMPQFEWMDEIVIRLESAFKLKNIEGKVIDFEQNPYLKGLEFFSVLFDAIIYKKPIEIIYKGFKQVKSMKNIVHPYYLKEYNNRWFLFGLDNERNSIVNYAIDRIESLIEKKLKFRVNEKVDFDEYFEDIVGVSFPFNEKVKKIRIKVSKDLWPYLKTKPLHGSQKEKEVNKDHTIIELQVIINFELISLLFSHAEGLTILEPVSLATIIKNKAKSLIKNYS